MKVSFASDQNIIKLDGVMVSLHCHHYNCGLLKALEEMEEINTREIIIQVATEEFYVNFKNYISNHLEGKTAREKMDAAADLYRFMGFGRLDLSRLNEYGGLAYADSSYYVIGWLAKYGRRKTPVCYLTCGFISGILGIIYGQTEGKYIVEEKNCMITGHDICEFVVSVIK
jgi:hypothetical protein